MLSFFFNDTATTEIYTLSLHDALPVSRRTPSSTATPTTASSTAPAPPLNSSRRRCGWACRRSPSPTMTASTVDRKSTRLNSSHANISYAVFCLKKKQIHVYFSTDLYHL